MSVKFSEAALNHCKNIRGKNYEGCNSDIEFCSVCKHPAKTLDDLERVKVDINNIIEDRINGGSEYENLL